jgi:hypothetical protein
MKTMSRSMIVGRGRQHIVGRSPSSARDYYDLTGEDTPGVHDRAPSQAYAPRADAPHVIEEQPTHPREFPIGFSSASVPANSTQGIETKPQVLFRGERLAIPQSIVVNFDVNDIKVGKDSQLAAPGNLPGECFSNLSIGVRMQLDTAEPGITITLSMFNNDANNAHPFKSCLYGTVIE